MEIDSFTSTALSALSTSSINSDIGIAVLAKQLDVSQNMGDNLVRAMELSVNPYIGGNFDAYA
mgnify:CR=1